MTMPSIADGGGWIHFRRAIAGLANPECDELINIFDTIGIPVLLGRGFRKEDEANGSTAVIVSEKLAQECWKGLNPLGRRIEVGDEDLPTFQLAGSSSGRTPRISAKTRSGCRRVLSRSRTTR